MKKNHLPRQGLLALLAVLFLQACSQQKSTREELPEPFDVSSMDTTQSPCNDFDLFVNGNWKKENPIPASESRWGSFNILLEKNEERLQHIIDELLLEEGLARGSDEQLIADFYRSYLDTGRVEELGATPLEPYLEEIDAVQNLDDYVKLLSSRPEVYSGFLRMYVDADKRKSAENALYVTQSGLSLGEKDYYENTDSTISAIRTEFTEHAARLFELAGQPEEQSEKDAESLLDFETRIAAIQMSRTEMRDPVKTYHKRSYEQLKQLLPELDWDTFTGETGLKSDTLVIRTLDYLKGLGNVLEDTPAEQLRIHVRYHLLRDMAPYLPTPFQEEAFRFYSTVLDGIKERKEIEKRGLRTTNSLLGFPLGKLFVTRHFPESSKEKMMEMIEYLRDTYRDRIQELSWMSDATKEKALQKLEAFTYKIGYPDEWKDYSDIDIRKDALFENVMNIERYEFREMLDKLGKPVDKKEWYMSPQTVNAYYNPEGNEIVFPAGILQPPFFNPEADDAINYGGIMAVIGHEFSHGFDDQGSQYDGEGNLNNWWTEKDRENFDKLTNQLDEQFSKVEVLDGVFINGRLTLGENIADLAGVTMAWYALKRSLEGKPEPEPIDGFNWKQRFFLSWAQIWRNNTTNEFLLRQVKTDPHSPARERINILLRNIDEFYEAWECEDGENVLPRADRVYIW